MMRVMSGLLVMAAILWHSPVHAQAAAITPEQVANATFTGIYEEPVTLTDGVFEGEPYVEGGVSHPIVELTDYVLAGDFNRDGNEDAAVILQENSGGTGVFNYLAVLSQSDGELVNVGTALLGDRIIVEEFTQDDLGIRLKMIMSGPNDAMCCPTMQVRQVYGVFEKGLALIYQTVLGSTDNDASPIPVDVLANATYPSDRISGGTVTLVDGEYADRELGEFAFFNLPPAFGDLDGDDVLDAVVLLEFSGGGSGRFVYLYAVLNTEDGPSVAAWIELDSPIIINNTSIIDGQIIIDVTVMGLGDGQCCPTRDETVIYVLDGDVLVKTAQEDELNGALGSLAYPTSINAAGSVTLTEGVYLDAGEGEDGAESYSVGLSGFIAAGDLDGDTDEDAAAVLITAYDDGTILYDLYAVVNDDGAWSPLAPVRIGDRIEMINMAVIDEQVYLTASVFGPDDAECCPTQVVEQRYALEDGALTLIDEQVVEAVLYGAGDIVPGGIFDPDAGATDAEINVGSLDGSWLDPMLVSVQSGVVSGPAVDAQTLGETCAGYIPAQPDVVVNWQGDTDLLRLFILSMGDPVLVVVTPSGEVLCNDDYTPLVPDAYVEIPSPEMGRYAVFVGSFADAAVTPGFLVVTSHDLSPATLDLTQMMPREVDPGLARQSISADVLLLDGEPQAAADEQLNSANTPYSVDLMAGGDLPAFDVELGNELCTGFIAREPSFSFTWAGEGDTLGIMFEADADTTLVVRMPDGTYQCHDDADGANNLNPALDFAATAGDYLVWVGSFDPDVQPEGTLTIGAGMLTPAALALPADAE